MENSFDYLGSFSPTSGGDIKVVKYIETFFSFKKLVSIGLVQRIVDLCQK
jgi:hypothetical protein